MRGSISFQQEECLRCSGKRVVGMDCVHCGARARKGEVNASVVRRRQSVSRIEGRVEDLMRASRDVPHRVPDAAGLHALLREFIDGLDEWINRPSPNSEGALALTIHLIDRASVDSAGACTRRPGLGMRLALSDSSRVVKGLWDTYRAATTTVDPGEAKSLSVAAQAAIDGAWDPIRTADVYRAAAEVLDDVKIPIVERIFSAIRLRHPGRRIDELISLGSSEAREAIGRQVGANSGLAFSVLTVIGEVHLDPRVFRAKLRAAAELTDLPLRLRVIAEMDDALPALSGSHRDVFEAFFAYQAVIAATTDKRAQVRETGRLIARLYEASLPVFAWYTLVRSDGEGAGAFRRVIGENAANLAVQLARGDGAALFGDAQRFLRDAPNHGRAFDYNEERDEVSISLGSYSGTMSLDDYVDLALAFVETLLAAVWGLEDSLERAGSPVSLDEGDANFIGLTPKALARIALVEVQGLTIVDVDDRVGRITYSVEPSDSDLLLPAVLTARSLAASAEELVLTAGEGPRVTFALADWPDLQGTAVEQMMKLIRFKERSQVDDASALGRHEFRFVAGCVAHAVADGDLRFIKDLRELRAWALPRGWTDEADFCTRSMRLAREECVDSQKVEIAEMVSSGSQPVLPRGASIHVRL